MRARGRGWPDRWMGAMGEDCIVLTPRPVGRYRYGTVQNTAQCGVSTCGRPPSSLMFGLVRLILSRVHPLPSLYSTRAFPLLISSDAG